MSNTVARRPSGDIGVRLGGVTGRFRGQSPPHISWRAVFTACVALSPYHPLKTIRTEFDVRVSEFDALTMQLLTSKLQWLAGRENYWIVRNISCRRSVAGSVLPGCRANLGTLGLL